MLLLNYANMSGLMVRAVDPNAYSSQVDRERQAIIDFVENLEDAAYQRGQDNMLEQEAINSTRGV